MRYLIDVLYWPAPRVLLFISIAFLWIRVLPALAIEGSFRIDSSRLTAKKNFIVELEVSMAHVEAVVLRGAPEVKLSDGLKLQKVSSYSRSSEKNDLVFYRYELRCESPGEYIVGPGIITYFTKADPSRNDDRNLSLAEITKKAVDGEKVVDTHTRLVQEERITVRNAMSFYLFVGVVIALMLGFLAMGLRILKHRKRRAKKNSVRPDYAGMLGQILGLKNREEYGAVYERLCRLSADTGFDMTASFAGKIQNIRSDGYVPTIVEVENDIRAVEKHLLDSGFFGEKKSSLDEDLD